MNPQTVLVPEGPPAAAIHVLWEAMLWTSSVVFVAVMIVLVVALLRRPSTAPPTPVPPWFLDSARAVAEVRSVPLDYVFLRPSVGVWRARVESRRGSHRGLWSASERYADFDEAGAHIVGENGYAASVATRIQTGLEQAVFRLK